MSIDNADQALREFPTIFPYGKDNGCHDISLHIIVKTTSDFLNAKVPLK